MRKPIVVAIPARDEAQRIGRCLHALARQTVPADHVVLLLNNCTDGTAAAARAQTQLDKVPPSWLCTVECSLPTPYASAGMARSLAMDHAARLAQNGVLLTTDADAEVAPDWVERNLAGLAAGADAVCGMAVIDPEEARLIPQHLHADDAREVAYGRLLDEIGSMLLPDAADPWPRHSEESGASLAIPEAVFRQVGGVPDVASGEDRALITRLRSMDARVRHDPGIAVVVSGRIEGRAPGGMADTMQRRMVQQDEFVDERIEPALEAFRRLRMQEQLHALRRGLRCGQHRELYMEALQPRESDPAVQRLAWALAVAPCKVVEAVVSPWYGAGWAALEAESPTLLRRRVAFCDLPRETARALRIRDFIRLERTAGMQSRVEGDVSEFEQFVVEEVQVVHAVTRRAAVQRMPGQPWAMKPSPILEVAE